MKETHIPAESGERHPLKQTADHLGISLEEVMKITMDVMDTGEAVTVEVRDGKTTVKPLHELSDKPPKP